MPRGAAILFIMPFFSRLPRLAAVLAVCACLPPTVLANVVEAAASTLFEAAPLLIGAEIAGRLIRRPRALTWLAALMGCGCGPLPGALTAPAAAFCALTFGPVAALGRGLGAFTLMRLRGECRADRVASPCVLDQLGTVALLACLGALFLAFIRTQTFGLRLEGAPSPLLFTVGMILGLLTPCTPAALALATGLRTTAAPLAFGVLCSAGLLPTLAFHSHNETMKRVDGRFIYILIGLSCLILTAQGGAGLVHPKLAPLLACGVLFSFVAACGACPRVSRKALFAALLMLAGPILNVPPTTYDPGETTLENIYPGQEVRFSGEISGHETTTTLVRYAVTCCRADASPLALRLDRRLAEHNGLWVEAEGKH